MTTIGTLGLLGEVDWLAVSLTANQAYEFIGTAMTEVGSAADLYSPIATGLVDATFNFPLPTETMWFTPESTGTYYVSLSDIYDAPGLTYSVSAVTEPNDYTDNSSTAGRVTVGGAVTMGTLGVPGEIDWLAVSLDANQAYEFTVTGLTGYADIVVGAASELATDNLTYGFDLGGGSPGYVQPSGAIGVAPATNTVWFTPESTGTYYVALSDTSASLGSTYGVSAVAVPNDHADNTTTSGIVIPGGAVTTGTLGVAGEIDWLAVSLAANQAYAFTITGLTNGAEIEVGGAGDLGYMGDTGFGYGFGGGNPGYSLNPYAVDSGATLTTNAVWFTPERAGTYYVALEDASASLGSTYGVSAFAVPNDHTDNTTTSGLVTVGGAVTNGTLALSGEVDWLAVSLTGDQAYEFTITGLTDYAEIDVAGAADLGVGGGLPGHILPDLIGPDGATVATETAWFTPDASGTYYVGLTDEFATLGSAYGVSAVAVPNDHADNTTTSGIFAAGGAAATGTLGAPHEIDWLAVSLTANQAYDFTITGLTEYAQISVGDAADLGAPGGISGFGEQDNIGGVMLVSQTAWFTPESTGTYYVELSDAYVTLGSTYTVSAVAVPNDHTDNTTTDGIVSISGQQPSLVTSTEEITSGEFVSNPTIAGGNLILDSGSNVIGNIYFSGAGGVLTVEPNDDGSTTIPGNEIFGFEPGDTIELAGVSFSGTGDFGAAGVDSYMVSSDGDLTVVDGNGTFYDLLIAGVTVGQENFVLSAGLEITETACYAAGTSIAMQAGQVAVEDLAIGDFVLTLHSGPQRIKWIGQRSYDGRFIAGNKDILPVCIKRHAIAKNVPARDLFVSPGHAICIDGALIHAFRLVNGVSITQVQSVERVTYYHIETERHQVIFAENCPAETFLDENFRAQFENAAQFRALYPGQAAPGIACLKRLESGFALHDILQQLRDRAGILPQPATHGPLRGYVDEPGPTICSGWAQDLQNPESPVRLDIMVGGTRVACVLANLYRADLRAAGVGSGCHGFRAVLPAGVTGRLEVRRAADGAELLWSEAALGQAA